MIRLVYCPLPYGDIGRIPHSPGERPGSFHIRFAGYAFRCSSPAIFGAPNPDFAPRIGDRPRWSGTVCCMRLLLGYSYRFSSR